MFNENQKKSYIDFYIKVANSRNTKSVKAYLIRLFNKLEKYEQNLNKDLSMMDQEELKYTLSEFLKGSIATQSSVKSTLGNYFNWCLQNNLTLLNENYINNIAIDTVDSFEFYKQDTVSNEEELRDVLNEVLKPVEADTIDNLYRLYCHLLFNGVSYKNIFYLKECDVSLKNKTINDNGNIIYMSDILYKLIKYYLDMIYFFQQKKGGVYALLIPRTGYLLENSVPLERKLQDGFREKFRKSFVTSLSIKLKDSFKNLNSTNIYNSGVFYRIYLKESKTGEIDLIEYLNDKKGNLITIESPTTVKKRATTEYLAWKKAFNL